MAKYTTVSVRLCRCVEKEISCAEFLNTETWRKEDAQKGNIAAYIQ